MNFKLLAATVATAALAISAQAHATVYNFWFDNVQADGGTVDGTVFGKIYGLGDDGVYSASDVVILSHPAGLTGLPATPFTVQDYADDLGLFISQNFFIVNNQHIDYAVYQIWGGWFDMNVYCCGHGFNSLVGPNDPFPRVQNLEGMSGLRFAAAPEPGTWAMMLTGFGGLGALLRSRRKLALA